MLKTERAFTITSDKFHEAKDEICTQILLQELAVNFFSRSICDRDRFCDESKPRPPSSLTAPMNHVTKTGAVLKHFMIMIIIIIIVMVSWMDWRLTTLSTFVLTRLFSLLAQDVFFGNKRSCLGILFASSSFFAMFAPRLQEPFFYAGYIYGQEAILKIKSAKIKCFLI